MNRTRIVTLLCLLVPLLAIVGSKLLHPRRPEPTFCGRTVTQWLSSRDYETNRVAVNLAVLALGESSVPALRRMLHSGSKWDRMWFAKAPRWLYRRVPVGGYQFERKAQAMWALQTLGRAGRQATPDLLAILQDTTEHWNQRSEAITTLRAIEAEPSVVLPVMDKLKADPVVGTFAASEARSLRWAAERQRYGEMLKSVAASVSARREVPKTEFQPPSSLLDKISLWGSANSKPRELSLGTNLHFSPLDKLGRPAANSLPRETDNPNATNR